MTFARKVLVRFLAPTPEGVLAGLVVAIPVDNQPAQETQPQPLQGAIAKHENPETDVAFMAPGGPFPKSLPGWYSLTATVI